MKFSKVFSLILLALLVLTFNIKFSAGQKNIPSVTDFKGNKVQNNPGPLRNFRILYTRRFRGMPSQFSKRYGNKLFVHTSKTYLYCVNIISGGFFWIVKTDAPLSSAVSVFGNYVYATDTKDQIYKISIFSGRIIWKTKMKLKLYGCWGTYNDHVFCPVYSLNADGIFTKGKILRINVFDGKVSSEHNNVFKPSAYGLSEGNIMYVPGENNLIIAYDMKDLRTRFSVETEAGLISPPIIGKKRIFVVGSRKLYAINKITGKIEWIRRLNLRLFRDTVPFPRYYNGRIFLGLRGFNVNTGQGSFVIFGKGRKETDIYIAGNYLYYAGSLFYPDKNHKGFISVFDINSRTEISFKKINHIPKFTLTVYRNLIYYFDRKGSLYCLTGTR